MSFFFGKIRERTDLKIGMQVSGGHLLEPGSTGSTPLFAFRRTANAANLAGTSKNPECDSVRDFSL